MEKQYCFVRFADGRVGEFEGKAVISREELNSGSVPRLVSVDFSQPLVEEENAEGTEATEAAKGQGESGATEGGSEVGGVAGGQGSV